MQHIAIFGDIHANIPALETVITDITQRGLRDLYCLGDLVGYGTSPNQVIEEVRSRQIPTIFGNYDEGVGKSSDDCGCAYRTDEEKARGKLSIAWTNEHTTDENKAHLRELPFQQLLEVGDLKALLVHGSPRKVNEYLYENRPDRSFERLLDQTGVDVLVCGHTHLPYHKVLPSGRHVINAGSVGKPKDKDPRAGYIILHVQGKELMVEFVRLTYDIETAARSIEAESGMPDEFADMLRRGVG